MVVIYPQQAQQFAAMAPAKRHDKIRTADGQKQVGGSCQAAEHSPADY
ncbi:MAG: hypothetical protein E6X23_10160 [Mixta calida]|nr:hypothetical protein [Mixta calida]MBS6059768.1 hypothetical protein [Pantoea sp.]MDU3075138.1 hypothetical protein [Mixta calida]MDU3817068.1 hypothetical protein [Pantoea sp.]MDU4288954.1 hypothetical protein [Mixta calida]MDU4941893.1 hypothetical protein [Mixta calida]